MRSFAVIYAVGHVFRSRADNRLVRLPLTVVLGWGRASRRIS